MNHYTIHLKLTQYCKSTTLQLKKRLHFFFSCEDFGNFIILVLPVSTKTRLASLLFYFRCKQSFRKSYCNTIVCYIFIQY